MEEIMKPTPMKKRFITPGVAILILIALNGLAFLAGRFLFGLGGVTNLDNQHPWGIWIAIDVAAGVALAAGGFTTAALGHIMRIGNYEAVIRPALLTALLGYTFVGMGVCIDLGRYYSVWHPLLPSMWNGNSALFEVGMCVMAYLTVLYIEFLPIVTERFAGKVNLPGLISRFNKPIDRILHFLDRILSKTMFVFIILGVVLSCLHQSSLGTLMIISGPKIHPLWQTPILPLLFLMSAISVGFPMVIMESILASRSFGLKPELHILSRLGRMVGPLLGVYLAAKLGDMFIRETFVYLAEQNLVTLMFFLEIMVGILIPMRIFFSEKALQSPAWLFTGAVLVIAGVLLNRINTFLIAYTPAYNLGSYFPSFGEISVTLGFIAIEVLLYRMFVKIFPVISVTEKPKLPKTKYAIKGTTS
ncbi:MAG: Ni/Fe-hydrogenase cytochrome b subunit [Calditrichales bacterium]|nr:MAG: Ni/Fe-hydrogenase cytochrome b subunit [Calditrichales bacterium]